MQLLADDASKIDLSTIKILDKIEDLKAQVQERYYQSLEYSPFQFPTTGGLSFLDSHLRKNSTRCRNMNQVLLYVVLMMSS